MSSTASKSERRKEQNRRAQANLRKRQQQKLECLEEQIVWLKSQTHPQEFTGGEMPVQTMEHHSRDYMSRLAYPDSTMGHGYDNFQYIPMHMPNYGLDETISVEDTSTMFPETLSYSRHHSATPFQHSSITSAPLIVSDIHERPMSETRHRPVTTRQHHCAFDALTFNASLLNISPESFLSTHSNSPFYSPFRSLDSIAASIIHLPPDFHPTMAQLSYPHQPWIDCVPLRDLRSRIIFAVSHRPPLLDSLDLWHDVLSDGLSCGADPRNTNLWTMSDDFMKRWQILLTIDLETLEQMCLTSNPPVRMMSLSEPTRTTA